MFDPTAFDNMKVVVEGALYDLDLAGEIVIIDRNDIMNLAKLSRCFDAAFQLPNAKSSVTAKFEIASSLKNMAAELLSDSISVNHAGCNIKLQFDYKGVTDINHLESIHLIFNEIWVDRRIIQSVTTIHPGTTIQNRVEIGFDRLIGEEQMDDLVEMIGFMVKTIQQLQLYLDNMNKL